MTLLLVPIGLREANGMVERLHRHHRPVPGCKFCLAAVKEGEVVGCLIAGRPLARHFDDGQTPTLFVRVVATEVGTTVSWNVTNERKGERRVEQLRRPRRNPRVEDRRQAPSPEICHAGKDGDCCWKGCPQLRDGEPIKTGRHCPLDKLSPDAEVEAMGEVRKRIVQYGQTVSMGPRGRYEVGVTIEQAEEMLIYAIELYAAGLGVRKV